MSVNDISFNVWWKVFIRKRYTWLLGKVLGVFLGFSAIGGVVGALAGFLLGFLWDLYFYGVEKPQRKKDVWNTEFAYLFTILHAKFAKIDGVVTPKEVRAFQSFVIANGDDLETIQVIYNKHRKSSDGFERIAVRLLHLLSDKEDLRQMVVESLYVVGFSEDGKLKTNQKGFIQGVGRILSLEDEVIAQIRQKVQQQILGEHADSAYDFSQSDDHLPWVDPWLLKELALTKKATKEEIKKAYRRAIHKHHPDKLRGQGASEVDIQKAQEKLIRLNEAYSTFMGKN